MLLDSVVVHCDAIAEGHFLFDTVVFCHVAGE